MQRYTVYFIWKLPYTFRVVPSPIIRRANNCIYSIWYLSRRYCYLPLSWKSWNRYECAVGGVRHYGWWYNLKRVEQFPDKIYCVTLHLVEHILSSSSSSCSGRIRFDSCSLYPQNEIGSSISSSVVLCVFVLLVCWTYILEYYYDARTHKR